ncbi:hypothetical protein Bca4012_009041 [Brassica carinata]|uniref:X8 domain-containing protein n=1 Tax=Brassica carinata TaxID=52824 RepID=A0A8X7RZP8_BRACI|nr:hypothetical protein Bca52824_034331 [Brassica carinata]
MRMFLGLLLLLTFTTSSSATYCLCKDGVADNSLQAAIDYACGIADCSPIKEKGPCYLPNTIRSHCDWAVNSYFQKVSQAAGSCNFSGTATTSQNPPSNLVTGCTYPSSASSAGSPPPPTGTTPTNGTRVTPSPGTPPAFAPPGPGGLTPSKGASSLVTSPVFIICFSSLAFLM